ncbi:MAG: sensor histidine kinase [Phormidesmis sp.]
MDLGQVLALKQDKIIKLWIDKVRSDGDIDSTRGLTYKAILDSLPQLIETITHLLSHITSDDLQALLKEGIDHGAARARQGYDAEEIVREYAILRDIILDELEVELLPGDPLLLLRALRLVNGAMDRATEFCFKRYTEERLQEVNLLYDELVTSNQELDRLVVCEKKHLAHLAHELKSPLSSIIGYSDLFLRQQANGGPVHPKYIEQVRTSGRRLLGMIDEALEMSAYRAGKVRVDVEPVQVCDVVTEVAMALETLAQQKGLAMLVTCEPSIDQVATDKKRLRQVVTNVISNALRYTECGSVEIHVRSIKMIAEKGLTATALEADQIEGDRVEIEVTDTGLGIDVVDQSRIFEPYYQGKAGQQLPSSTGLGLAIAREVVQLLQGSIQLSSEPEVGSTFTIALPLHYQSKDA